MLDGVNLTIRPGEIMGLVGKSGCGKTTLANAILGILARNARHEAGTIRFGGEDLLAMPRRRIEDEVRGRRITFIPQDPYGSFNPLFPIGTQTMEVMKWKSPQRAAGESRGVAGFFSRYPRARRRADAATVSQMLRAVQIPGPRRSVRQAAARVLRRAAAKADDRARAAAAASARHRR